ncbi:hypothetical protein [Microcoleus sp. herbarium12]
MVSPSETPARAIGDRQSQRLLVGFLFATVFMKEQRLRIFQSCAVRSHR